ncbi:sulfate/molybdate ABC transporter ATP-binding protein [Terrilactibacillus laevilacticus]|uniref:Sulfate/molybdate ABC transporter ATP-binding protein n=1 Tax=Terrilactibacillus laevilacticus TaxID=1380157 RepID=A0ABW5PQW1_9BACI
MTPFGALDAKVRKELRNWLRHLHQKFNITSVFVTHDQEEAFEVADRVVIINNGKIEQIDTPEQIYENPASPFVYDFIGNVNLIKGNIHKGTFTDGYIEFDVPEYGHENETPALGFVRPHNFLIEKESTGNRSIKAKIEHINATGPITRIELEREDNHQLIEVNLRKDEFQQLNIKPEEYIYVKPNKVKVFRAN